MFTSMCSNFNPRSPHGERRGTLAFIIGAAIFQPTLPARGATADGAEKATWLRNFNPRSPHGERRRGLFIGMRTQDISTHAPRTGSDILRGACLSRAFIISTHAPRTGSDSAAGCGFRRRMNFNPRSPHGERLPMRLITTMHDTFQPTLPARGATQDEQE